MVIFNIEFQQNSIENYRCFYKLKLDQNSSNEQQTDDVSLMKRIIGPVGHYQVTFDMVLLVLSSIFRVLYTIYNNNKRKIYANLMDFLHFRILLFVVVAMSYNTKYTYICTNKNISMLSYVELLSAPVPISVLLSI